VVQGNKLGMTWYDGLEHIVREGEILAPYTGFRLGGPARYFAEPTCQEELAELLSRATENSITMHMLGSGSNVLVPDDGVDGLVIHLSAAEFAQIQVEGTELTAGGGTKLVHLVSTAAREGLSGLEQLAGIPGTVGGALRTNAGTDSGDIGQWTRSVTVMTRHGEIQHRTRDELRFSYRQSNLDEPVVLSGTFQLEMDDPQEVTRRVQKLWIQKRAQHPVGDLGAGRIFKDHGGVTAESLIDQAGLQGLRVGGAEIHEQHGNYIVVRDDATCSDVEQLIESIQRQVEEKLEVELQVQVDRW
jgi:UDP-N-acetylmuramate dehydrogenase